MGARAFAAVGLLAALARGQDQGPPPLPTVDPEIRRLLTEISAERIQRSVFVLSSFKTRHTLSDPDPSGDGIGAAAGWVRTQFERIRSEGGPSGRLSVAVDTFRQRPIAPRVPHPVDISNIIATLPGSRAADARRIYLVCAHYDSRVRNVLDAQSAAPGADDDASGVAAVIELARVMSHYDFPATLMFVAFAGEEQALLGSAHLAAQMKQRGGDIEGVFNNDIIGNTRAPNGTVTRDHVRLFGAGVPAAEYWNDYVRAAVSTGGESDLPARSLARAAADADRAYLPDFKIDLILRRDRYRRDGDHGSFLNQGYPAVRFTEPAEDYTHEHEDVRTEHGVSYGDVADAVDFGYIANVARANAAAMASLARAPRPPQNVEIETAILSNDTTLRWQPSGEPDVAGYRIVWRDSAAAFWQHHHDVSPAQTRVTLPIDKDEIIFGVEAFDTEGHISRAVFPLARRTL